MYITYTKLYKSTIAVTYSGIDETTVKEWSFKVLHTYVHKYRMYKILHITLNSLVASPPVSSTSTWKQHDDGLSRTSTGFAGPSFSLTLYFVSLNLTEIATSQET